MLTSISIRSQIWGARPAALANAIAAHVKCKKSSKRVFIIFGPFFMDPAGINVIVCTHRL